MDNKGTFTPDAKTVEWVLEQLASKGVNFDGCTWNTAFQGIRLEGDQLVAENYHHGRPEGGYWGTLVDQNRPSDGKKYRGAMFIEDHQGRDKVGDVVVEIRLDPMDGRYKVHFEYEQVFEDPEKYENLPRATRSSLENDRQSLKRRSIDLPGGGRSNPRRIAGKRIAQHSVNPNWGPNLVRDEFMDVYDYVDATDMMGQSTLLRSLKYYPAVVADEIYRQIRNPDRVKKIK
jgi:hypothetical protein